MLRLVRNTSRKLHRYVHRHNHLNLYKSRSLLTLAIESSCDDTSVAILEKYGPAAAKLHFHERTTADTLAYGGVHPIIALESHQRSLAKLVKKAISFLPAASAGNQNEETANSSSDEANHNTAWQVSRDAIWCKESARYLKKPDLICVTRGPGMRPNLFTGIDTAKGLSVAWQIPIIGVHHMQAHALTPRLVCALERAGQDGNPERQAGGEFAKIEDHTKYLNKNSVEPSFPFLSLLVSGGHTLLVHSRSLTSHEIWASTSDIAIGDAIDKIARCVLPSDVLRQSKTTMYGALLEQFAFGNENKDNMDETTNPYSYTPPATKSDILNRRRSSCFHWGLSPPLTVTKGGLHCKDMRYCFSGILSSVARFMSRKIAPDGSVTDEKRDPESVSLAERQEMAREAMRVAFEHLATRVMMGLNMSQQQQQQQQQREGRENEHEAEKINTLVLSGGVAANRFLRHVYVPPLSFLSAVFASSIFPL